MLVKRKGAIGATLGLVSTGALLMSAELEGLEINRQASREVEHLETITETTIEKEQLKLGFYSDMATIVAQKAALKLPEGHQAMCDALLGM